MSYTKSIEQAINDLEGVLTEMSASDFKHYVEDHDNGELENAASHLRLAIELLKQCQAKP